jgi:uncharacterized membrane protein
MMGWSIAYIIVGLILLLLVQLSYRFRHIIEKQKHLVFDKELGEKEEDMLERYIFFQNIIYLSIVLIILSLLLIFYFQIKSTIWLSHYKEWLNLIVRWMHITFGIAWIGASFYFVFLENALNRTKNLRGELSGNLWAVHGGGFYYLEKYKTAPKIIPKELHWFKYEAYFTWLSGMALLAVVFYFNADSMLVDLNVYDMSALKAIVISIASMLAAWFIYDLLCKSPLIKKPLAFALLGFVIAAGFAWFFCNVFNPRAAYIHFGAIIGTIMAGNVFFTIIPAQKAMVFAAKNNLPLNPQLGKNAGLRSLHNNYFTLPVLFVMISNHFPSTFGHEYQWIILALISLASAGVKHYLNLKEKGQLSVWVLPVSVLLLLAVAFVSAPQPIDTECNSEVGFTQIYPVFQTRCVSCHSSQPTDDVWRSPPNGIVYDTPEDIRKLTDKIMQRVVITKTMPNNNKTGMTPEERELLRCWIEQGARLDN